MSVILQPDDMAKLIEDLQRRILILETQPARSLEVRDSSGILRVRGGVTSANHYGLAIYDAAGIQRLLADDTTNGIKVYAADGTTVIWDSTGIQQVPGQVANSSFGAQPNLVPPITTFADLTNTVTGTWTVPAGRVRTFLCLSQGSAVIRTAPAGAGCFLNFNCRIRNSGGGATIVSSQQADLISTGLQPAYHPFTPYAVAATLGPGTYEAVMMWRTGGGAGNVTLADVSDTSVNVFQFGV